ncbi:MAG: bifunctional oligoribonuclease/PAP phosphatase NrnA [Treponema sp.]|jgi:phosphoesterase RecJ-like protein|nr:bifunctional oligoribonuclease/PAP phosphatase NrnA [Treponema sp.]
MLDKILAFIDKYRSFILTTHDPADADGLGAELIFAAMLKSEGKEARIINAGPIPELFRFMDPLQFVECWDPNVHQELFEKSALIIVDTSDEYFIGTIKSMIDKTLDVFVVDHHEPKPFSTLGGIIDPSAAATCELAVEITGALGFEADADTARAVYAGLVFDTGFFAYSKTSLRTFAAALKLVEWGVVPYEVYHWLNENASTGSLLLQKQVLSTLEFHAQGVVAVQVMRKEDLTATGARFEDAEGFISIPLRAKEVAVSILIKETPEGKVRCSLRSKAKVNVSKIAQAFGGGGHVSAAGFISGKNIAQTLEDVIEKVEAHLDIL